jgi:zinc transporter 1/2/3
MFSMFMVKLFSGILLAILTLGSGIIPFKSENFKQSPRLLSISNAFAGGIFLAIGLVDLMPEA